MRIEDAHGGEREYDPAKLVKTIMRVGFDRPVAEQIEEQVRDRIWEGITTTKIYSMVYEEMKKRKEGLALRYRLRESIANLNPNYHEFEKFVTKLLREDGMEADWSPRPMPQGGCIEHEIDVVARKHGKTHVVECKHHYHHHRYTGLDVPMRQWARLQDLRKGNELGLKHAVDADNGWVIGNTKLSRHAKRYAECTGIRLTGWKYPEDNGLERIVERNKAYPVTMLRPPHHAKVELSKRNILTLHELLSLNEEQERDLGLKNEVLIKLQKQARDILED